MNELLFFLHTTNKFINNYQKIVEKDYIFYNIIAIKRGRIDPGRTGNRGETTRIHIQLTKWTWPI
jgi:hypothetical protein